MSGLEVVGVVLGAIPLIITAVDHYKTNSQRIKLFRFKEPYIAELIQALKEQHFFLETDLHVTLRGTHLDDDEIADLLAKPGPALFSDPDIAIDMQKCLGEGYGPYTAAVARCHRILSDIATHIRGLTSTQAHDLSGLIEAHPVKNGRYEITKKIKFTLDKGGLDDRIKELNDATEKLRRVRDYSSLRADVTIQATSRASARYSSTLKTVRDYAHRLYQAISGGYAGGCHNEHQTFLFLQSRSEAMDRTRKKSLRKPQIYFPVAFPPVGPMSQAAVTCYITEIKVDEEVQSGSSPSATASVVQIVVPPTHSISQPQPSQIDDLCRSLSKAWSNRTILDLYLTQAGCLSCSHVPLNNVVTRGIKCADVLSLDQILQQQLHAQPNFLKWTLNQRISLSFNIASSLLQLYSTHWLTTSLTSESIHFTKPNTNEGISSTKRFTEAPKPFIIHKFPGMVSSVISFPSAKRSLLELGIVLLELWHCRTLASYATEIRMIVDDSLGTRYEVARKWLDISAYFMLPFYLDVVTRCVECTFATSSSVPHWDDIVFRKSICEYVLRPLWENCPSEFR